MDFEKSGATTEIAILADSLSANMSLFIPKGTPCTWEITKTLRKSYMIADV